MFGLEKYTSDFKLNLKLALPIMAGQLGQVMVNLADSIMVGRLGAEALAAVAVATAIFVAVIVLGMGLSFALPALVSEADGANEERKISSYFKHSLAVNMIFAIVTTVLIYFGLPLLDFMGQDPEVLVLAKSYLLISAWSLIPMMLFLTLRAYSEGMSKTIPPMIAMIVGNVINVVLNYLLIFGHYGLPEMGVDGAALASFIARVAMVFLLLIIIFKSDFLSVHLKRINLRKYNWQQFKKVLRLGVPSSLQMFFEVSAFSGAALIAGMVSKEVQAAHQIAINLASITFLICTGLAMASTIRVGNQLGKKDYPAMRKAGMSALVQVSLFMAIFSVLFVLFRSYLPYLYIDDEEVVQIAATLLIFAAIFQIPDGVQVTALSTLRGIQDVKVPTLITLISYYLIGIPTSYISAIHLEMGGSGVWLGLLVGLSISATLLTMRFNQLSKRYL